jgi:hypothetical protein
MTVRLIGVFICLLIGLKPFAQLQVSPTGDTASAAVKFARNWEKELFDIGISVDKDSLHIDDEAKRLLTDPAYRQSTYPAVYNWPEAIQLLKGMELKKAFYHMINLYKTDTAHKIVALQTFVKYDSLVDMEKILTNSFYTYVMTDPEICVFKDGKPVIRRPDILEAKFKNLKEIIEIVKFNRTPVANNR